MGDHADDANDRGMNEVIELYEYEDQGFPTNQDAYDNGFIDELGVDLYTQKDFAIPREGRFVRVRPTRSKFKTCKHCGFNRLVWNDTGKGWRLSHPDGEEHECEEYLQDTAWPVD